MILKETIAYYVNNGSAVYCTMLDATKNFDRVEYCKLFRLPVGRDLPSAWFRVLMNIYNNSSAKIAWNNICSALFLVDNGVKQGGVMSRYNFVFIYLLFNSYSRYNTKQSYNQTEKEKEIQSIVKTKCYKTTSCTNVV